MSTINRFGIVTRDFVFVDFQHFQNISFGDSVSHLVYDPSAFQTFLGITKLSAFALSVVFLDTRAAQAE